MYKSKPLELPINFLYSLQQLLQQIGRRGPVKMQKMMFIASIMETAQLHLPRFHL